MASSDIEKVISEENADKEPAEIIPGFATIEEFTKVLYHSVNNNK